MNIKKYINYNKQYISIYFMWTLITVVILIYSLNFSNNFYIEATEKNIENIQKLELVGRDNTIELKPEVNGKGVYIESARIDLKDNYIMKITKKGEKKPLEVQVPYSGDTRTIGVRLEEPTKNKFLVMQITNSNNLLYTMLILALVSEIILTILAIVDFLNLKKLFKLPKHIIYLNIETPTQVDKVQVYDKLLRSKLNISNRDLRTIYNDKGNSVYSIDIDTILDSKSRNMRYKITMKNKEVLYFKVKMHRYTDYTSAFFSNQRDVIIVETGLNQDIINPYKIKYSKER